MSKKKQEFTYNRRKEPASNGKPDPTYNVLELVDSAARRLDDIANLRAHYEEKLSNLRERYQEKLSAAESDRVNANRDTDTKSFNTAHERLLQQIANTASQLASATEVMRGLVATGQAAVMMRIESLEKSSYVGSGKAEVADPMLHEIFKEVKEIKGINERASGKSLGSLAMWGYIVGGIGSLLGLMGIISFIVRIMTPLSR